jgi:hypothetical protein
LAGHWQSFKDPEAEKFAISLLAAYGTFQEPAKLETQGGRLARDVMENLFVEGGVADNAFLSHLAFADFKLGLDEGEQKGGAAAGIAAATENVFEDREDFQNRDKRDVHRDDIEGIGKVSPDEETGIFFNKDDPGIFPEADIDLPGIHVHGIDFRSAPLEQAVRETARGRADVCGDFAGDGYLKSIQRPFELEPAAADVGGRLMEENLLVEGDELAGFFDSLLAAED